MALSTEADILALAVQASLEKKAVEVLQERFGKAQPSSFQEQEFVLVQLSTSEQQGMDIPIVNAELQNPNKDTPSCINTELQQPNMDILSVDASLQQTNMHSLQQSDVDNPHVDTELQHPNKDSPNLVTELPQPNIVQYLPTGYSYLIEKEDCKSECNYSGVVRIAEINDYNSCQKWMKELSTISKVTWRIARTFPNSRRINIFKCHYRCQHNVQLRRQPAKRKSKNRSCPAQMKLLVRRYHLNTRSKHPDPLVKDWPCILEIQNVHSHSVQSSDTLRYRPVSEETKEKLTEMFLRGHTPYTALDMLKVNLLMEHPLDYHKLAADAYYIPTFEFCYREYSKLFTKEYGGTSRDKMIEDLHHLITHYNSLPTEGKAALKIYARNVISDEVTYGLVNNCPSEHLIVAICTPIMQRAHELIKQANELIFLDTYSFVDRHKSKVLMYMFATAASVGGAPIGCVVTDTEGQDVFSAGLDLLLSILPEGAFFGSCFPQVLLMGDDLRERVPLVQHFPQSVHLLSQFHVLKSLWRWLSDAQNGIGRNERHELFERFKSAMCSETEEELSEKYLAISKSEQSRMSTKFQKYCIKLWEKRRAWGTCFRCFLPIRGSDTTNFAEVIFRMLTDNLLHRAKSFNFTQIVDFVLTRYESYTERRLLDFARCDYIPAVIKEYLPPTKNIDLNRIVPVRESCYDIPSEKTPDKTHTVNMDVCVCSCHKGPNGQLCKHQSAVISKYYLNPMVCFTPTPELRQLFFKVATGGSSDIDWFLPLDPTAGHKESTGGDFSEKSSDGLHRRDPEDEAVTAVLSIDAEAQSVEDDLIDEFVKEIRTRVEENPELLLPALRKMLKNAQKCASDAQLANAMCHFGKKCSAQPLRKKRKG